VPSLAALCSSDIDVVLVVTTPDKPAGRGLDLRPSEVKLRAAELGLPVHQPPSPRSPELAEELEQIRPDVCVVVAYGKILPHSLLEIPRLGFVNLHFSLLPLYRGAAPVQRALMDGVTETGVSVMVLTEGMDEGPVLASEVVPVGEQDTGGSLGARLANLGAPLLTASIESYARGDLHPLEQDHERATYAPKISGEDARLDWSRPARALRDLVRALNPVPGAWAPLGDKRLKVFRAEPLAEARGLSPGELRMDDALFVGTGDVALELVEVQLAGRKRMSGTELARGLRESATPGGSSPT
jgi:methionyl-tRNA formyltransferase